MAKIGRLALFWRAFFLSLIFGSAAGAADEAENSLWQSAVADNSANAYFNYLSLYPAGDYVDDAVEALVRLGALSTRGMENPDGQSGGFGNTNQSGTPQSAY